MLNSIQNKSAVFYAVKKNKKLVLSDKKKRKENGTLGTCASAKFENYFQQRFCFIAAFVAMWKPVIIFVIVSTQYNSF